MMKSYRWRRSLKRLRPLFALTFCLLSVPAIAAEPAVTYEQHVQPFFKTYCTGCHNDTDDSKAGLNLLTYAATLEGADSGPVVVAGKSSESRLIELMTGGKPRMPPKDAKQPTPAEIALVRKWVDLGATAPLTDPAETPAPSLPHLEPRHPQSPAIPAVAFSPNGKWLAAAHYREVWLFDSHTGKQTATLAGAEHPINALAVSPDSQYVAAGGGAAGTAGVIRLWKLGEPNSTVFTGHADSIYGLRFLPNGRQLISASYDKLLLEWDLAQPQPLRTLKHHTAPVFAVTGSPDGKTIASVSADSTLKLWSTETGERLVTLTESTKGLNAVAFHPNGKQIAAVGIDRMIRIWDWNGKTAALKKSAFGHDAPILSLAYAPDGRTLFTGAEDRRLKAWDSTTLHERHVYPPLADWPLALAVDPDGAQLAVGLYNGSLLAFDTASPQLKQTYIAAPSRVAAAEPVAATKKPADKKSEGKNPPDKQPPEETAGKAAAPKEIPEKDRPNPAAPRFDSISPRTVVCGRTVKLRFSGPNLWDADQVFVSTSRITAKLLPGDPKQPNVRQCEVTLPADLPPQTVQIRLHTPLGSTGAKPIYVGPFEETGEKEPKGSDDPAVKVTLPRTLTGSINHRGDRDRWSFEATAGQEIVCVATGPNLGSGLHARLSLLDAQGKSLATAVRHPDRTEVVLGYRIPETGTYTLQVEDRHFTGAKNLFYVLHAGTFGYITESFPLAIRAADAGKRNRDEVSAIGVSGYNLSGSLAFIDANGKGAKFVRADSKAGQTLNSARYDLSPHAEYEEIEPNNTSAEARAYTVPVGISGRIAGGASLGDIDQFAFTAKKGESLVVEVFADRRGSPLDATLEILSADGTPVGRHTLRAVAETYTVLRDHASRTVGIRLANWDDFAVDDLLMLGGEIVKIEKLPLGPDEDVKFYARDGQRLGHLGTTPQAHALNSAAYKIEVHPPGLEFPPNGMPVVQLPYVNDDGGPGFSSDSWLPFEVPADGRYIVRLHDVRGEQGEDYRYRLVIRPRQPDFRVSLSPDHPNIPRGGSLPVTVNVDRLDGFAGAIDVHLDGLPVGIVATDCHLGPDAVSGVLTLTAADDALQPAGEAGMQCKVTARSVLAGQPIERRTTPSFGHHQVSITSPPDLRVQVEPAVATISPGADVRFTVTIERRHGFKARVPIEVLNLPHGLRVLDVGLNGVLVTEDKTRQTFVVHCDPWAEPGVVPFFAAGRVEAKKERHASSAIRLEVKSAGLQAGR